MKDSIILEDITNLIGRLILQQESLRYAANDLNKYKEGFELSYLLDFAEIHSMMFVGKRARKSIFPDQDLANITKTLLEINIDRISYALPPATMLEILAYILRTYEQSKRISEERFTHIKDFAVQINSKTEVEKKTIFKLLNESETYTWLECLIEEGAFFHIAQPINQLHEWIKEGKVLTVPSVVGDQAYNNLTINRTIFEQTRVTLDYQNPGHSFNNIIDAANVAFTAALNKRVYSDNKFLPFVSPSNSLLRVAKKEFEKLRFHNKVLVLERSPLYVSAFVGLLNKVGTNKAKTIIDGASIELPKILDRLYNIPQIKKLENARNQNLYFKNNRENKVFLEEKILVALKYFQQEYGEYLQIEPSKKKIPKFVIPLDDIVNKLADWKKSSKGLDEMLDIAKDDIKEFRNLYGDFKDHIPIDPSLNHVINVFELK